jgi:pectate lyase
MNDRAHRPSWIAAAALSMLLSACGGAGEGEGPTTEQSLAAGEELGAEATSVEPKEEPAADDKEVVTSKQLTVPQNVTGFAAKAKVTGGEGGHPVTVSTAADLERELCRTRSGGICTDVEKRIIYVKGVIDLTSKPGELAQMYGCYTAAETCPAPLKPEMTVMANFDGAKKHCTNKTVMKVTYSPAGLVGMLVGSNKTVIGLGSNAGLKGRGLLLQGKVSNIIIRNLSITDINQGIVLGGDAIKIWDASRVWIDHNYFARIARQMISSSTSPDADKAGVALSSDITISNNEFDGRNVYSQNCSGKSYWGLLMAGADRLTLVGNWMHDFGGRWPKLDAEHHGSVVHLVNNLFENSAVRESALQYDGSGLRVFVEGNYFHNVAAPVRKGNVGGALLFGLYNQTTALKNACISAIGRICSGNVAEPADNNGTMVQDSLAIQAMKPHGAALIRAYPARDVPQKVRANAGVGRIKVPT